MEVRQQISERLSELAAIGEDEELPMSERSRDDFLEFIRRISPSTRPYISMLDCGSLRAVWQHEDGRQIGLHFLETGLINFAFYVQRHIDGRLESEVGRADLDEVLFRLKENHLYQLYSEGSDF